MRDTENRNSPKCKTDKNYQHVDQHERL